MGDFLEEAKETLYRGRGVNLGAAWEVWQEENEIIPEVMRSKKQFLKRSADCDLLNGSCERR